MNTTTSQKLKIGLFTIAGILVLLAGIFLIGSKKNMFSSTYNVYGVFKNAGGLQVGNNVRFGGVNVGTVKGIRIISDTVVRVDMIIQTNKSEFIKNDAVASIGSDGLMGDKLLDIQPGSPNAPKLEAGGQMRTAEPVDIGAIMNKFSTVADNATVITGALANMALQIKSGNGSISRLLYKDDLALGLQGTLDNTKALTASLHGLTTQVQSGRGSMGELLYTNHLSSRLDSTVSTANAAMGTIQQAAYNFSENMRALQGNFFFKSYFKKKAKAEKDSIKNAAEDNNDMNDDDLQQMRDEADRELQRRKGTKAPVVDPKPSSR